MNIPRITRAIKIPSRSTSCSFSLSIFSLDKIIRNTKRLSIDSEYSVIQPAKNSADLVCPPQLRSEIPKAMAAET